ncbi:MAG: hypothetical protein L3J78_01675, partial [Thermoplasmata archaeon]|nr:hypothetical protein [Thermoplasmata archaeon]
VGIAVGIVANPTLASAFFTGAGYFVQSKVVTTIAEDQPPGLSQIILSFGLFTFGVSLCAVAYLLWQIPRRREHAYSLVVIWAFVSIFMALTGARFIFNAAPAFAITAGFAIDLILARSGFATMRRTYRSLAQGSWRNAIRKSVKARHVLAVLGMIFLVLLPNVWSAVDASIPFELKAQYDKQIADLLPSFLRAPGYTPGSQSAFYFGAFGYSLPRPQDYYPAAWDWFATQDANTPPELRPAFLSWWDYGFEAVDRGSHPTVADNFQDGVAFAGQFITSQNETRGIALLAIRLLEADIRHNRVDFSPAVKASLTAAHLPVEVFRNAMLHPADYASVVLSDVATYGPWTSDLQPANAMYIFLANLVTRTLTMDGTVSLYHSLRDATGWDIGYFGVDSRLFPVSAQNTGIFYAPVKLSDHHVIQLANGQVLPIEFFQILATTSRGSNLPIQIVSPGDTITSETIQYQSAFYKSMFYRAYVGYSPADLGSNDTGIPGISQALASYAPQPAWNLTHWRAVYRTAYYNPFKDPANHTTAWRAVNYDEAARLQRDITAGTIQGVVDSRPLASVENGVVFLRYYDGAYVNGTVRAGSTPLPNVSITVTDETGTPHGVTRTDAQGHYSTLVPFGNVTITASVGSLSRTTLIGSRVLATTTLPVTLAQAMRVPADTNGDSIPDWIISRDLQVPSQVAHGTTFYDLNRNSAFDAGDAAAPGVTVTFASREFTYNRSATSAVDGRYSIDGLPEGSYAVTLSVSGRALFGADATITTTDATRDLAVPFALVRGFTSGSSGSRIASAAVSFRDETNRTVLTTVSQANGSYRVGPLLAGNFTVTASSGDLVSPAERIRATGSDFVLNLTLAPSGTVAGTMTVFGTARPFATLSFQSATDPRTVQTVTADGNAGYSIRLAAGTWFVSGRFYDSSGLYATLGTVSVTSGATSTYDAMFLQGVRVIGTIRDPNPVVRNPAASLAFASPSGELWLQTDANGNYLAFLPSGTFAIEAFNQAGAYFATMALSSNQRLDIGLASTPEIVSWSVYRDVNGNAAMDVGEG